TSVWRTRDDYSNAILQRLDPRTRQPSRKLVSQRRRITRQHWVDRGIFLVIIDRALGQSRQRQQPLLPRRNLFPQPAFGQRQRGLALRFGFSLDQVSEPFGLGQVDPAVLERAAGEFARLVQPHAVVRG